MDATSQHTSNIEMLARAVQELSVARNAESVIRIACRAARRLTGAQGASFVLPMDETCYYTDEDSITPLWKGTHVPAEECIAGWVMLNRNPAVIADIRADPRTKHPMYQGTFVKSLAMVPVRTIDPMAAIGCYWAKSHIPDREEQILLQSLADIVAVTLENIRVYTELEERVLARTRELELANNELESFSYSVSHDLRAPLRGINGFMNILLEEHGHELTDEARAICAKVVRNAREMSGLIEGLLAFFKMGKKEVSRSHIAMKSVAGEIVANLRDAEPNRRITVQIGELPDAMADRTLIRQVWHNLVANAIKYTGKKEEAHIEIGFTNENGRGVYFIRDNGAGFDMVAIDRLFKVFQRLHSQREFEGSGIGLAIVQKIISKHGGQVGARSTPNEGATFYFSLGA